MAAMHQVGFFICEGYEPLDLAGPMSAFNQANRATGRALYQLHVLSRRGGTVQGIGGMSVETRPFRKASVDTVIFVGGDLPPLRDPANVAAAKNLAKAAPRLASVCTGAFILAEAGLLDGLQATTHWQYAADLQTGFPATKVLGDRIYITDGRAWTSAGIAAGIDLALALIESDHGPGLARQVARLLVVPYRRSGGQSQFSEMSRMEPESDRIRLALNFAREHLSEELPIERLAEAARLSVRQFGRAFRRETGETPAKAVERLRVEAARVRLQEGAEPVEQIAAAVGFSDPERMRRAFVKLHGQPPQSIRRAMRLTAKA